MRVLVKWHKSPLKKYGLPFGVPGGKNLIEESLAKKIQDDDPDFLEILEKEKPVKVKDSMVKKTHTRPVTRGQKDS